MAVRVRAFLLRDLLICTRVVGTPRPSWQPVWRTGQNGSTQHQIRAKSAFRACVYYYKKAISKRCDVVGTWNWQVLTGRIGSLGRQRFRRHCSHASAPSLHVWIRHQAGQIAAQHTGTRMAVPGR